MTNLIDLLAEERSEEVGIILCENMKNSDEAFRDVLALFKSTLFDKDKEEFDKEFYINVRFHAYLLNAYSEYIEDNLAEIFPDLSGDETAALRDYFEAHRNKNTQLFIAFLKCFREKFEDEIFEEN